MTWSCSVHRSALSPTTPTKPALYPECFHWRGRRRPSFVAVIPEGHLILIFCPRLRQSAVKDGRCMLIRGEKLVTPPFQRNARRQAAMCTNIHEHRRHGSTAMYPKFEGNSKASALPRPSCGLGEPHGGVAVADQASIDDSIELGTSRNASLSNGNT